MLVISAHWFCILRLCWSCLSVWEDFRAEIMLSANRDHLTSSFSNWIPFISFSCLIALVRTSNIMLNRSGERGHPCLVPDFKRNSYSFCPFSMILAVGLSYIAFIILWYVPLIPSLLRVFSMKRCWILSKVFSASIVIIMWSLSLVPFMLWIMFMVCVCWTRLAPLEWSLLDCDG